jgi:hypothetical protein
MNGYRRVRLGTVSVLFTVVVLCISVLAVLSVATVRADKAMAERYAQQMTERSELENQGQQWLKAVDSALQEKGTALSQTDLPEGTQLDGTQVQTVCTSESRILTITLELNFDGTMPSYSITAWDNSAQWEEDTQVEVLQ